jgi:hypothetical protein
MTPSGSSRAAATSATLPLLTLTILVSTVLLGCLSPGVSASAAAKDALKKGTAPSDSTTGGGRATDAAAAAAAAAAATTPVVGLIRVVNFVDTWLETPFEPEMTFPGFKTFQA